MISAKVVQASRPASKINKRTIVTYELRYNRTFHDEFLAHRAFGRCAMSERATPVAEMLRQVRRDPALPIEWGANQRGMQAPEELKGFRRNLARKLYLWARWPALIIVWILARLGLAKQVANRLLTPWAHVRVVATITDPTNFFALRCHPAALPEMRRLAEAMFVALQEYESAGKVQILKPGQWHLPYIDFDTADAVAVFLASPSGIEWKSKLPTEMLDNMNCALCAVSSARCARVSVLKHDGTKPTVTEDLDLFGKLHGAQPMHASPMEHQATPAGRNPNYESGNLRGWEQFRQLLPDNVAEVFDPEKTEWTPWAWFQLAALGALKTNVLNFAGAKWTPIVQDVEKFMSSPQGSQPFRVVADVLASETTDAANHALKRIAAAKASAVADEVHATPNQSGEKPAC
jgi:hypothetical protein